MKKALGLSAILLLVCSGLWSFSPQSGYDQFQKALAKERSEGKLEEAIALYQKVIDGTKDESLAAQAQLRIGLCYEKLGREEARKAFQKVLDNYPAQTETVKTAREKLALLQKGQRLLEKQPSLASLRLVWEGPDIELMGAASPDGRYICYTDWETGDLAIRDLQTGGKQRLTGQTKWDGSFVENSRWSPDGKLIAYTWDKGTTADLRIVGLDGSKPRILYHGEGYPSVMDWSQDGRQILTVLYAQGPEQSISVIDVSDGSVRHLKKMILPVTHSSGRAGCMGFSHDGRFIAFDYPGDIHLLSADGRTEIPLVKHPANDHLLGWTPDGKSILFTSDRSGAIDAWIQPVKEGKPGGEPELVRKDVGAISPLGFTRDGAFFYGHGKDLRRIYVATIDRKTEALTATYQSLALPYEGRNDTAEFSPDGKQLAFVRRPLHQKAGSNSLCVFSLETGEEKTNALGSGRVNSLNWALDGASILVSGFDEKHTFVRRTDTRTGESQEIFPPEKDIREEIYLSPTWPRDGRTVYCVHLTGVTTAEPSFSIIAKDLSTGQTRVVFKMSAPFNLPMISVSPDGERLAALEHPRGTKPSEGKILKIISTKDGDVRELCRFASASNSLAQPRWSADGQYIYFPGQRAGEEKWDIWYVSIKGGEPRKLGLDVHRLGYISPHPDGRRIAFDSFGPTLHGPEVWVMENFLPGNDTQGRNKR